MFLTTGIFFFIHWASNFKVSARTRTQYFDSQFVYIWTLNICPFRNWRTVFSCPWFSYVLFQLLPTLSIFLFDSQPLIRRQLRCIFLPSRIQIERRTRNRPWRAALKPGANESVFTFTLLVFRTKLGAWHKRIQLMKGSHFPSTRINNNNKNKYIYKAPPNLQN